METVEDVCRRSMPPSALAGGVAQSAGDAGSQASARSGSGPVDHGHLKPSSPLSLIGLAVGWRRRESIEVDLAPACKKHDIGLYPQGAKRLHAAENRVELMDGTSVDDDYLVIATNLV